MSQIDTGRSLRSVALARIPRRRCGVSRLSRGLEEIANAYVAERMPARRAVRDRHSRHGRSALENRACASGRSSGKNAFSLGSYNPRTRDGSGWRRSCPSSGASRVAGTTFRPAHDRVFLPAGRDGRPRPRRTALRIGLRSRATSPDGPKSGPAGRVRSSPIPSISQGRSLLSTLRRQQLRDFGCRAREVFFLLTDVPLEPTDLDHLRAAEGFCGTRRVWRSERQTGGSRRILRALPKCFV